MTKAEKIKRIDDFCDKHSCSGDYDLEKCPYVDNDFCKNYSAGESSDEVIDAWYDHFFGEDKPHIKDSGNRTEFDSGAVRDIQEGKGRCDLLPLDVVAQVYKHAFGEDDSSYIILQHIAAFIETGDDMCLFNAVDTHCTEHGYEGYSDMFLEVAKHFEEGALKYGENNWQKGLPVKSYINSAVRHYLKWLRGDDDEPHDRAFVWNLVCCIWTCQHKPELNGYGVKK